MLLRTVRYAVACLDLDVLFKPAPRGSSVHRPFVVERGGKSMFPYMIDPNTGTEMYESGDIIKHLYKNYGPGEVRPCTRHHARCSSTYACRHSQWLP